MKGQNHGLIHVKPTYKDYHQKGPVRLGGLTLQPNGQWDLFLPPDEFQAQYVETMSCTIFALLKCVGILERRFYSDNTDWSERWLSWKAGTTINGNDPNTAGETLRKSGTVYQADWPYTADINTWAKYFATPPYDLMTQAQAKFKAKYNFGHQWIGTDPESMMKALKRSPLTVGVYAWEMDENGLYYRPKGARSGHDTCIYGYEEGKYWKCEDSYPPYQKRLRWDFGFDMGKEYTLDKQVVGKSNWWDAILYFFNLHPSWH